MKRSSQLLRYCILGIFVVILMTSFIFKTLSPSHYHHALQFFSSDAIIGNGNIITKTIPVSEFNAVNVDGKFYLVIDHSDKYTCTLSTDENIISKISISTGNKILDIHTTDEISAHPKLTITSSSINQLNISGKTQLHAKNLNTDNLSLMMNGKSSGNLDSDIKNAVFNLNGKSELHATLPHADHITVTINGKGTIYLNGETKNLTIISHGKANVIANNLLAETIVIESAGESNIAIHPIKSLTVQAFGKSDIQYSGDPVITKNIFGESELKKIP